MRFFSSLVGVFLIFTSAFAAAPTTQISPDAQKLLEQVQSAYKDIKSLKLSGDLIGDFDVDGEKRTEKEQFTSSYAAPNRFRHEMKNEGTIAGSTGEQVYAFSKSHNVFTAADAPKGKSPTSDLPAAVAGLLSSQDVGLTLAITSDVSAELTR